MTDDSNPAQRWRELVDEVWEARADLAALGRRWHRRDHAIHITPVYTPAPAPSGTQEHENRLRAPEICTLCGTTV
jgi:hypothetical protein